MSCFNCFKSDTSKVDKNVTFSYLVTIINFEETPIEPDVVWRQAARNRLRFRRRALDVEQRISWVFAEKHRKRMFNILYL